MVCRQGRERERRWYANASGLQCPKLGKTFDPDSDAEMSYEIQQEEKNVGVGPGNA